MADIQMEAVTSSNVKAIGFDAETGTLYVQFLSGKTYQAPGAKQEDYDNWKAAKSKGQYHARILKTAFTWSAVEKKG